MASIGRGLAVRGDVLLAIDVMDGLTLTQASNWKVRGGSRPESWTYLAELPVPGGVVKRTLSAESVIHLRYATRPAKPWKGVSPLGMADQTSALAGWIEKRLAEEASTTVGHVLAVPDAASQGNVTELANELKALAGQGYLLPRQPRRVGALDSRRPRARLTMRRSDSAPVRRTAWDQAPLRR